MIIYFFNTACCNRPKTVWTKTMPAVLRRPGHNCLVWLVAAILGLCRADTASADMLLCSVQARREARHLQGLRQSTGAHLNSHSGDRQANNRCSRRSHGHTSWFLTIGPQASVAGKPNQCWKVPTPTWETKLWTVAPPRPSNSAVNSWTKPNQSQRSKSRPTLSQKHIWATLFQKQTPPNSSCLLITDDSLIDPGCNG